ncbi:MAG: GGDEF domain-containing protein [Candidatus Dormibacteria bacterium]
MSDPDIFSSIDSSHATRVRLRFLPAAASVLVLAITLLAGAGWLTGSHALTRYLSSWASMKPGTAACFALLAVTLAASGGDPRVRSWARVGAALVTGVAFATLVEYALGITPGLDRILGPRMAFATAAAMLLISLGFASGPATLRSQVLLAAGGVLGYLDLIGYAISAQGLYSFGPFGSVSLPTALSATALAIGGLALRPTSWLRRVDERQDAGGRLLRTLLPPSLTILPGLGLLAETGLRVGWWSAGFVTPLITAGGSILTVMLVVRAALRASRVDEQLAEASAKLDRDPLTGAGNRRLLERALSRVARESGDAPVSSILAFDLDDFKSINDTYGHAVGDRVLIDFADLILTRTRPTDVLARVGGDEFLLLLPHTVGVEAKRVAANLRDAVRVWRAAQSPRPDVSIGVAIARPGALGERELIAAADAALYRDKRRHHRLVPA